jgi:glycosyltransferase involved in cell wall biosynthesis
MQLCNALINFIFRQKINRNGVENNELVSILIPARNEEANIGNLLEALRKMENKNFEIIVCNDHSTDNTEEIVKKMIELENRVQIIQSAPLPQGWLGKNHACYQLAQQAKGRYLLFVDADVILLENIVSDAVSYAKKYNLALISIFPKQLQLSVGEKLTVPLMNYILLTLLPLIFVRISPFKSHAAANGQFMLFSAPIYKQVQPHNRFKNSAVEDIAISRFYKSKKLKSACLIGEERVQCRMYSSYSDALNGFSKNIFMFFGNLPVLALLFWACATVGILPLFIYNFYSALAYLGIAIFIQILYAATCKQRIFSTVLYFPVHLFFMFHVMLKSLISKKNKNYIWKGRNIS